MALKERYFIIRPDGTTFTVDSAQLGVMREKGLIGQDDRVIPLKEPKPPISPQDAQTVSGDEVDTAPINAVEVKKQLTQGVVKLEDLDIEEAFAKANSKSFYQLEAERAYEEMDLAEHHSPFGFHIRYDDGRIIGPFTEHEVLERIQDKRLLGKERIFASGTKDFQTLHDTPSFHVALLLTRFEGSFASTGEQSFATKGILAFILDAFKKQRSGFLFVRHAHSLLACTFQKGQLVHVRSNEALKEPSQDNLLVSLFALEQGTCFFVDDDRANQDQKGLTEDTLSLCRTLTSSEQGFSTGRILRILGDKNRILQVTAEAPSLLKYLSEKEHRAIEHLEQATSIEQVAERLTGDSFKLETAWHLLFFLVELGVLVISKEKVQAPPEPAFASMPFEAPQQPQEEEKIIDKPKETAGEKEEEEQKIEPVVPHPEESGSGIHIVWSCVSVLILSALLWILSVDLSLGHHEGKAASVDLFLLVRAFMVFLCVSFVYYVLYGKQVPSLFQRLFFKAPVWTLILSVILGIAAGIFSPSIKIIAYEAEGIGFVMAVLAALSTSFLFSCFVLQELLLHLRSKWLVLGIVLVLHALYAMSYVEIYKNSLQLSPFPLLWLLLFVALPTSCLQIWQRSVTLPVLYHLAFVAGAFMLRFVGIIQWPWLLG